MSLVPILLVLAPIALLGGQDDLETLSKKLKDPSDRERREAVQGLAKLATPAAWKRVLDALKDASPMVADEAQIRLGGVADAATLKEMLGHGGLESKDHWVRLRVAEALGRIGMEVDAGTLGKRLLDKDLETRRALAWSIERLGRKGYVSARTRNYLLQCFREVRFQSKDAEGCAAILMAQDGVGALSDEQIYDQREAGASDPEQCALEHLLFERGKVDDELCELYGASEEREALPARRALVEGMAKRGTRGAARGLVSMLERETNLRLSWMIADHLARLSGAPSGIDRAFWRRWADGLPADWKRSDAPRAWETERRGEPGTAVFMGMPVLSDGLAILVDLSGSLWQKREDGRTRKETLDVELRRALEVLKPDTRFNLVPYTDAPIPWEKGLVPATSGNVKRAIESFEACKATGKGNFWDAAMLAFEDPKVDTILLFSDGAPTGGRRWNLDLMRDLLAEKNRFRHVVIDAVIVDAKKPIQEKWKAICEDSGGRMLAVDLK